MGGGTRESRPPSSLWYPRTSVAVDVRPKASFDLLLFECVTFKIIIHVYLECSKGKCGTLFPLSCLVVHYYVYHVLCWFFDFLLMGGR